jgi:hypothetical protein
MWSFVSMFAPRDQIYLITLSNSDDFILTRVLDRFELGLPDLLYFCLSLVPYPPHLSERFVDLAILLLLPTKVNHLIHSHARAKVGRRAFDLAMRCIERATSVAGLAWESGKQV